MATVVGATAALAPALQPGAAARAQATPAHSAAPPAEAAGSPGLRQPAAASGEPSHGRLRQIVVRALQDSIATWKQLIGPEAADVGSVNVQFVTRLGPTNCYGLYAGEGPAYCSGNHTVFVGTREANRLMTRFGARGEAGVTFLIGHEMGHHIQNIFGRFQTLNYAIARAPGARVDLVRRFELEADCYAGVWVHASPAWARSARFRSDMLWVLASIGDDTILGRNAAAPVTPEGVHGTSEQRRRWFVRGVETGDWHACDVFTAATP
jgi:predicted metalloprotease